MKMRIAFGICLYCFLVFFSLFEYIIQLNSQIFMNFTVNFIIYQGSHYFVGLVSKLIFQRVLLLLYIFKYLSISAIMINFSTENSWVNEIQSCSFFLTASH